MPHIGNRTSKRGGQLHNTNATKSGCYRADALLVHDGRTREARFVATVEANLISALGGDLSPQMLLLCRRAAFKSLRVQLAEKEMIQSSSYWSSKVKRVQAKRETGSVAQSLVDDYLHWSRELREDLKTLGLERKAKEVQDLKVYLQSKAMETKQS